MAKRTSDSGQVTSSTSPVNGDTSTSTSGRKITLRIKSSRNSSQKVREDEVVEKEAKPRSSKRSKSSFKKNIDPNKPKKPPTAFFYFLEDFRRGYQIENPGVKSMRDIGKAGGEKWKIMTFDEKVKYYDIATEKRAAFDRAMVEYIRRKESGEEAGSEDPESEFEI